jgi:putative heme-binding domain-containing protein
LSHCRFGAKFVVLATESMNSTIDGNESLSSPSRARFVDTWTGNGLAFIVALLGCSIGGAGEPTLQVPPGFVITRVAGPPEVNFPMFATLDNQGRLYVTESSGGDLYDELQRSSRTCRISVLEDRDGDGRYELARVFGDKLTPSMGVAWGAGKLYAADPPELVTLQDTDGDGRADKRSVVLSGFGHSDNGSLHGLTFGPDGWLYFTMGSPDGYDLHGPDGSHARGTAGALIRCQPDGSRVETVAHGFENLVEVVFLPDGSIVGTLNWYQLPERGVRDALIQILEGSQFPLHPVDLLVPYPQFTSVLPPLTLLPAVGISGLEICRGDAFPPEMRGNLFSAQHNTRKIARHRLTPKGAAYAVENFDFVTTEDPDVHFSDLLEDADGSLLVVDTGSWYVQHCPTGRIRQAPAPGGIYRVSSRPESRPQRARPSVQGTGLRVALRGTNETAIAAAVRAAGRRAETNDAPEFIALLRSTNLALRLAAAEALAHCGNKTSVPALIEALAADTDDFLEHALTFSLHCLADEGALLGALDYPSAKVQRAALLLLDVRSSQAAPANAVVARLNATDARLRDAARWVLFRHPEWGASGAAFLSQLIAQANPTEADRQALGQFLPLFQTNTAVISAIVRSLDHDQGDGQHARMLEALAALDMQDVPAALAERILQLLGCSSPAVLSPAIRASAALRVSGADAPLAVIARDSAQPARLRLEALRELVRRRPAIEAAQMDFLLGQLSVATQPSLRLAAAETLNSAKLDSVQMAAFLNAVRGDAVISPAIILAGVEPNSLRADNVVALLDYLSACLDAGWTLSIDQLTKVQVMVPEAHRERARKLLARLDEASALQRQKLAEFEPLLKGGDYVRGAKVFHEKAQCTVCHRVWGNGGRIGPDLTGIGSIRSGRDILESLVLPSSTIAQGYDTLNVTMKDEESYTGVRVGRSDDPLVLRVASGAEMTLHANQIKRIDRSKLSIMPEGLLNTLTRDEVRDLLGYLQQLK